jgi:hypothetical protein
MQSNSKRELRHSKKEKDGKGKVEQGKESFWE